MFHTPRQVWQLEDTLAWERAEAEEALAAAETEAAEAEQAGLDAARELREAGKAKVCHGAWARTTIVRRRHSSLRTFKKHRASTNIFFN